MKIAFFSPLNPQRSGISDYSEALLPHLAAEAEIDLFVDGIAPSNEAIVSRFQVFDYRRQPQTIERLKNYDAVLYHIGNDHRYHAGIYDAARAHPGIIVLHDFVLHHSILTRAQTENRLEIYLAEIEACHGRRARVEAEKALANGQTPPQLNDPLMFPLNSRLANEAEAIIVHSQWSRARLARIAPATPVKTIPHFIFVRPEDAAERPARRNKDARNQKVQIASFGFVTPDKGIERALRALANLREKFDFQYTLVGEIKSGFDLQAIINELDLRDRVSVTGHVGIDEFARRIDETDIAINLRESTSGETSGSLCRIMSAGVAAIVSNVGWFSELPASCVVKIDMDAHADALLETYLAHLLGDENLRRQIGANARREMFAHHRIEDCAAQYLAFIREIIARRAQRRLIAGVAREAINLGINVDCQYEEEFMRRVAREIVALAPVQFSLTNKQSSMTDDERADFSEREPMQSMSDNCEHQNGRFSKLSALDYARGAIEYPQRLDDVRRHYLLTKPFYNLATNPFIVNKNDGAGMDVETHRHFCDFANMAVALALPANKRILDVGCGSGWLSEYFARMGYDVTGVDISSDLVAMSRERLERVAYTADPDTPLKYRFIAQNIEDAPLVEKFDAVICYDSLHHFVDEHRVMRHLAQMVEMNGQLFILEGDKPPDDSAAADELRRVMQSYATLESPFHPAYLRQLLDEHGFAITGDYISVNKLFDRHETHSDDYARAASESVNYLLCKKVAHDAPASSVPDSRAPANIAAALTLQQTDDANLGESFIEWQPQIAANELLCVPLLIENTGDTWWRAGDAAKRGVVMIGVKVFDENGALVSETHGTPPLPRAVGIAETISVLVKHRARPQPCAYTLIIDMVDQHICWFEERGSIPLVLPFEVL